MIERGDVTPASNELDEVSSRLRDAAEQGSSVSGAFRVLGEAMTGVRSAADVVTLATSASVEAAHASDKALTVATEAIAKAEQVTRELTSATTEAAAAVAAAEAAKHTQLAAVVALMDSEQSATRLLADTESQALDAISATSTDLEGTDAGLLPQTIEGHLLASTPI